MIDAWLKSTVPGEQQREDLQKRLVYAKTALDSLRQLLDRMSRDGATSLNKPLAWGAADTALVVAVHELQTRYLSDVVAIPRALKGLSREVVMQAPTLPTEPVTPRKGLVSALTVLATGFVLFLWVLLRQAWVSAAKDPLSIRKQQQVLMALRLGK